MDEIVYRLNGYKKMVPIYGAMLLFSLHYYLLVFINSSVLSQFFSDEKVGLLYMTASFVTVILFLITPSILRKTPLIGLLGSFLLLETLGTLALSIGSGYFVIGTGFILIQLSVPILYFILDVYLQQMTTGSDSVGNIRTIFLTLANITIVISPVLSAALITTYGYKGVYISSMFFLIPLYILSYVYFKKIILQPVTTYTQNALSIYMHNPNLRRVFEANFVLKIFYAVMTIYLPIYLHHYIGFTWAEIGIILTIMLIPFVLFEIPFGYLADKILGEKEIMVTGFIITGCATIALFIFGEKSLIIMAGILFISRIGASAIESMSETYFFKKVSGSDTNIISFFRITTPLAFVVTPLIAGAILVYTSYGHIFLILGICTLLGAIPALLIVDTK